jgi:hypothetical protein
VLVVALVGGGLYLYSSANRTGKIELSIVPNDATVLLNNTKVGEHSPLSLERPPGLYMLSVMRDGYVRNDQNLELRAGQSAPVAVTLEPSPDTGFEFTSEPPGGLVWLDGAPINGAQGQQARTNFRAFRIPPGHHVLEIKGEARFKPWQQDVEIEPGVLRKIHAVLIPAAGGGGTVTPSAKAGGGSPSGSSTRELLTGNQAPQQQPPAPLTQNNPGGGSLNPGGGGGTPNSITSPPPRRRKAPRETPEDGTTPDDGVAPSPRASAPAAAEGGDCSITVNSIPWSEVWIDAKNTGKHTPVVDLKVPCGKHKLSFKRSDIQIDRTENINVRSGQGFKQLYKLETEE